MSTQSGWFLGALVVLLIVGEYAPVVTGAVVVLVAAVLAIELHQKGMI